MQIVQSRRHASKLALLRLLHRIFLVLTVLVWVLLGLLLFGAATQKFKIITVLSGSMEPAIPRGALIVTSPIKTADIAVGDVITFQLPTNPALLETHRVNKISTVDSQRVLETKGDANSSPDPWALKLMTEPAWKVSAVIPYLGMVFGWVRSLAFSTLLLLAIPGILIVIWIYKIWRPTKKKTAHS